MSISARPSSPHSAGMAVSRTRTGRGVRLSQHGVVLSEVLRHPGPTHSVADVLAALLQGHGLDGRSRVALLGFAGGGLLAPLRALGCRALIEGVDLDPSGHRLFHRLCRSWPGRVRFRQADAVRWLAGRRSGYHAIVDDLSVPMAGDVVKPAASWVEIPGLIRNRLRDGGLALLNWLPPDHESWSAAQRAVAAFFPQLRVVTFEDYENRVLAGARTLPDPRELGTRLRQALNRLGSRLATRVAVRSVLPRG